MKILRHYICPNLVVSFQNEFTGPRINSGWLDISKLYGLARIRVAPKFLVNRIQGVGR